MDDLMEKVVELFEKVKDKKPIVYQLASHVIMNDTSNALLALGAIPIASHCKEELDDVVTRSDSIMLNICNIDKFLIEAMKQVLRISFDKKKPVVLDSSGVDKSNFRRFTCFKLLEAGEVSVLRAKPYEIMVLDGEGQKLNVSASDSVPHAQELCIKYGVNCLIPGKIDYIVSDNMGVAINNGVEISRHVFTATAMLSSICAAFLGVSNNKFDALIAASLVYRIAGEIAVENGSTGPGTFFTYFLDALYNLNVDTIVKRANYKRF